MNEKCFDIGDIQSYLDGETTPEFSFDLTSHTAVCDECALLLANMEDEHSLVQSILDRELNTLVPTQRLWSNISVAINEEKNSVPLWSRIRMGVFSLLSNPSLVAAAGLLMFTGFFLLVWSGGTLPADKVAVEPDRNSAVTLPARPVAVSNETTDPVADEPAEPKAAPVLVRETNHSPEKLRKLVANANHRPAEGNARPEYLVDAYLPGEESYVRTIANLKDNIDVRKDMVMSPSSRVAFERDLAVVNDAIDKMKEIVKKDPKNQAAKQVLYSSYQNKIDLLNSVVEREELMASLQ
ncbi:MAG: hypothetical protein AB7Q37_14990 [Pyrinomonadaceae bacterium]